MASSVVPTLGGCVAGERALVLGGVEALGLAQEVEGRVALDLLAGLALEAGGAAAQDDHVLLAPLPAGLRRIDRQGHLVVGDLDADAVDPLGGLAPVPDLDVVGGDRRRIDGPVEGDRRRHRRRPAVELVHRGVQGLLGRGEGVVDRDVEVPGGRIAQDVGRHRDDLGVGIEARVDDAGRRVEAETTTGRDEKQGEARPLHVSPQS